MVIDTLRHHGYAAADMPEGDTLHRIARRLAPLVGARLEHVEFPRSAASIIGLVGERVARVEALGKNLLITVESGLVIHTHLRMIGTWHLYARGERWRRAPSTAVVILGTATHEAVCFRAPVVRVLDGKRRDPVLAKTGHDILGPSFDVEAAAAVLSSDARPIGEALLDQRRVAGIGNVWKSELLFRHRLDPWRRTIEIDRAALAALLADARVLMQANVGITSRAVLGEPRGVSTRTRVARTDRQSDEGPLSVYRRAGEACYDCGATIAMRHQGEARRSTYFCARCQGVTTLA